MLVFTRIKNSIPPGRGRRVCLASFFIILILMYCVPYVYEYSLQWNSSAKTCLTSRISAILSGSHGHDASVLDAPRSSEQKLLPFIGNGNVGVAINYYKPAGIVLRHDPPWAFEIPYYPIFNAEVEGLSAHSATILHSKSGLVHHLQCYSIGKDCVFVRHTSFAHRTRKSVIMQKITIENQTPNPVTLTLKSWGLNRWKGAKSVTESIDLKGGTLSFELISGKFATHTVRDFTTDHFVHIAIGISLSATNIDVQPHGSHTVEVFTVVQYTEPVLEEEVTSTELSDLVNKVRMDMLALKGMSFSESASEHTEAWKDIWKGEFVQEENLEEVNGEGTHPQELINMIMYYILSSVEAPLYHVDTSDMDRALLLQALDNPGSCYNGQPTLFMELLWESVNQKNQLSDLVSHWLHTLYKSGCQNLLTVGADGVMQAMLLSFLGGQFTKEDLSFHADPHHIKGSLTLKNLKYGSSDVDIKINKATETIQVQANSFQKGNPNYQLFACETGCKNDPVLVSHKIEVLALKWTEPMTPFLYISHEADHLVFLRKKVIHYRYLHTMDELPLIVSHKGIHVPVILWVFIGILISIFHLFLIRLIYNEYCSGGFQDRFRKKKTSSSI
ncbi:uncharacterized protein KIAA2013 homolog isoform X2 [Anneissia japonica]|nr:uncharacterized protein KIAA2013 homolog isoform X2 [Anneissia japonica]